MIGRPGIAFVILGMALLILAIDPARPAQAADDEDHQRLCPVLTEPMLQAIIPEVTGHGSCTVFCRGCGCKGGPGFRDQQHRCVGYADLIRKCGPPPHAACVAECALLAPGCDHGRVWVKSTMERAGFSVRFIPAAPLLRDMPQDEAR